MLARGIQRDEAFEAMFRELYPRTLRSVQRLLGDTPAAEDAAAEALARTFADWPKVRDLPYRDAWVLRVALNLALDTLRRKPLELVRPVTVGDVEEIATVRVALWAALRSLPRRQREIVVLRYLASLTEDEVAHALGISPLTVKAHMSRGLAALRNRLGATEREVVLDAE